MSLQPVASTHYAFPSLPSLSLSLSSTFPSLFLIRSSSKFPSLFKSPPSSSSKFPSLHLSPSPLNSPLSSSLPPLWRSGYEYDVMFPWFILYCFMSYQQQRLSQTLWNVTTQSRQHSSTEIVIAQSLVHAGALSCHV